MTIGSAPWVSFAVSVAALLSWRLVAHALELLDRPGGHKTHHGEIPVVGGLAMYTGFAVTVAMGMPWDHRIVALLGLTGFMVLLGALDDRFNLRPGLRLAGHFAAAIGLVYALHCELHHLGNLFGGQSIPLGLLALPFTTVGVVTLINGFNMLDGLDGLAGTAGLVGFIALTYLAGAHHLARPRALAELMVGAIAAFSIFNLPLPFNRPLRTFMGDAGSTLLGFFFAALAIEVTRAGPGRISPVVILWLIPLPIIEVLTTTVRRIARGRSPIHADNGHAHHVLLRSGFSVRAIWLIYLFVSAACALFGVTADARGVAHPVLFIGFLAVMGAWAGFVANAPCVAAWLPATLRSDGRAST